MEFIYSWPEKIKNINNGNLILLLLYTLIFISLTFLVSPSSQTIFGFPFIILATVKLKTRGGIITSLILGIILSTNGVISGEFSLIIFLAAAIYIITSLILGNSLQTNQSSKMQLTNKVDQNKKLNLSKEFGDFGLHRFEAEEDLEEKLNLLEFSVENISTLIFKIARDGNIEFVNREVTRKLGYERSELIGKKVWEIIPDYGPEDRQNYWQKLSEKQKANFQGWLETKAGEKFPVQVSATYLEYRGQDYEFAFIQDITEFKEQEEDLSYILYHDNLTGLYNRHFFEEEFNRLNTERQLPLSIIMADLNGLKIINDSFGHQKGDKYLMTAASILKNCCRKEDIAARWAGDEYILLLPQTDETKARDICQRIRKEAEKVNQDLELPVSIAIGSATKNSINQSREVILRQAEEDMYSNKMNQSSSVKNEILDHLLQNIREKGHESREHAQRMAYLARELADRIGLQDTELDKLSLLAEVHDIGKATLPDDILYNQQPLSTDDWKEIKKHPERGYRIALSTEKYAAIAEAILCHHERWDGNGYPQGLEGDEIPLLARILAIVDAYDIMTNNQVYKDRVTPEEALDEIEVEAGEQFDPELVDEFIAMMENKIDDLDVSV